jgi:phenylalanyl-tRNA synthetase beta chain
MRVPLSWLRDFVEINMSPDSLAETLTMAGLEIAKVEYVGQDWDRDLIRVGEILDVSPHPEADRLTIARVAYGAGLVTETVSGAPNVRVGDRGAKVVLALPGGSFHDPESDGPGTVVLEPADIRGVHSEGMLCSERELGISDDHSGVMVLDQDAAVGSSLQDVLGDVVLDLDLTPNLGRCLSIIGVAREVAALTGQRIREVPREALDLEKRNGWKCVTDDDPAKATTSYASVEIDQPEFCARYSASLLEGVTIKPSPMWMQNRLRLAGMRPINNVVDITNYCMWEWGQPLHAFDYETIRSRKILVRKARSGERIVTLDGTLRPLSVSDLLITDGKDPIAIAGVMGGLDTEVSEGTGTILLESANFELTGIRRTVQALKLPSEASLRFGKGIDPELAVPTLQRASLLMRDLASASVSKEIADAYPVKPEERMIRLGTEEVKRILGMDFSAGQISDILESLDFRCAKTNETGAFDVSVPTYRLDVSIPADLIEEVARIHGYEKIPATLMSDTLPPQRANLYVEFEDQIRDVLVGCGINETITYAMTSMESVSRLDPEGGEADSSGYIQLLNPTGPDKTHMRQSLLPGMLETMNLNFKTADRLMFFEIGRAYNPVPDQELPREGRRLCIALSGPKENSWWMESENQMMGFFHLKGIVDVLLDRMGIEPRDYEAAAYQSFHPGKSAVVRVDDFDVGFLGELHPNVQRHFDLPDQPIIATELDLDALFAKKGERRYRSISPFPAAKEDLAVVLKEGISSRELVNTVMEAGKPLVREAIVFDVWKGERIPAGEKSVAFSLTYQAADRVLKADEISRTREKIIKRLSEVLGATLRE